MTKLCINSRDELHVVQLDNVIYLKASGSYTDFCYANGKVGSEVQCLSFFEEQISRAYRGTDNPFYRLGRSYLINTNYVSVISLQGMRLDFVGSGQTSLRLSKSLLRRIKDYMGKTFTAQS